ncbi:MAG: DUF721 domain-containing protein [Candidatus Caldatribacterium sp.]|uniref:DciA family protein n=1 Tax=Candidatus Caldatribacterium sp. TaxID=2282143 RepID=UPI0029951270|nr:DUF721 domain-containing protein [Candidatus Caldatribacterium sp.]MCX7730057.1 DUF721 domain-containing protein [Candidatus Caldatribacterium sp.]MDW8081149.1 DciA family protein [Candidatus Calescibacterium sp.]
MHKPFSIGEIVTEYLKRSGLLPKVQEYQAMERFREWFPDLAPFCKPVKIMKGVLFLEVEDPIYTLEVESRVHEICALLNSQGVQVSMVKVRVRPRGDAE